MSAADHFPSDYPSARQRFLAAARDASARLHEEPLGDGEHAVDVARLGPDRPSRLLILSSGLHGVEGRFGTAVQLRFLAELPTLPADLGVVLIHAINPVGYALDRRFNERNVDLNRNFLPEEAFAPLIESSRTSLYARLDPWLNPPSPPGPLETFPCVAAWLLARHGRGRLRQSLPVGQYAFPRGLFFGGTAQEASTRLMMRLLPEVVGDARRILHLDWHTGLGDYATGKLLLSLPAGDPRSLAARACFGPWIETPDGPTSYRSRGDMLEWATHRFADRDYLGLCAEFGTLSNIETLKRLRRENRVHFHTPRDSPLRSAVRTSLREAFVPSDPRWRGQVLQESHQMIQRGLTKWANAAHG